MRGELRAARTTSRDRSLAVTQIRSVEPLAGSGGLGRSAVGSSLRTCQFGRGRSNPRRVGLRPVPSRAMNSATFGASGYGTSPSGRSATALGSQPRPGQLRRYSCGVRRPAPLPERRRAPPRHRQREQLRALRSLESLARSRLGESYGISRTMIRLVPPLAPVWRPAVITTRAPVGRPANSFAVTRADSTRSSTVAPTGIVRG